jgi:hypothetical protein
MASAKALRLHLVCLKSSREAGVAGRECASGEKRREEDKM